MICPLSGQCYAGAEGAGRGPRAPTPPSGEDPPAAEPCGMPGFSGSWGPGEEMQGGDVEEEGDAVTPPSYPALPLTSPDLSFTG